MGQILIRAGSAILIVAAGLILMVETSQALRITEFGPPVGPGLGDVAVPQVQTPVKTVAPNNDNSPGPSDNEVRLPGVLSTKPFARLGPIDIIFTLAESGGSTEYFFTETVTNDTGRAWGGFGLELGLGTLDGFAPFHEIQFLRATVVPDFDTPDRDPSPTASAFARLVHEDDTLRWSDGLVPAGATVDFTFSIDVADDPLGSLSQFTLRQSPTPVSEPSGLLLLAVILASCRRVLRVDLRPSPSAGARRPGGIVG